MNLFTRIARDSLWLLIARIGAQASLIIVTYLLARRLGAAGFGEYAFIAALILIGNVLTTFGSDMYLIREIAAKKDFSEAPSVLTLQLLLSCLFIGLVFLFAGFLPNQTAESVSALKVYSLALIPLAFFTVFTSILRGAEKMTAYAALNFILPFIQAVAIFIFIQRETSIVTLAYLLLAVQTLGAILGGIFCIIAAPGFLRGARFSLNDFASLFFACLPIALIAVMGIIYQKLSLAMLAFLSDDSTVGMFSAAARVSEAARMGHIAAFTVLYPALASADNKSLRKMFGLSQFLLLVLSAVGSILLFLLAKPIVDIFFGAEYASAIPVLKILAFTLIPFAINAYLSLALLAEKKETIVLRVLTFSLILLLALNLWLIPLAGQVGAGWAVLAAETVQAVAFALTWARSSARRDEALNPKGVLYELSDPSQ